MQNCQARLTGTEGSKQHVFAVLARERTKPHTAHSPYRHMSRSRVYLYINSVLATVAFGALERLLPMRSLSQVVVGPGTKPSGQVLGAANMSTTELRADGLRIFRQHVMLAVAAREGDAASAVWRRGYQFHPGRGWTETDWAEQMTEQIFDDIAQDGSPAAAVAQAK